MTINEVLDDLRIRLNLEADAEYEVVEEIRTHLEQVVEEARGRGVDEQVALSEAAARFGVEEAAAGLHEAHLGRGIEDGVTAVALPVICALVLRWLVFTPDGSITGWQEILVRPAFWVVALIALVVPLLRFPRWRYALASWAFFWAVSVIFTCFPALHW